MIRKPLLSVPIRSLIRPRRRGVLPAAMIGLTVASKPGMVDDLLVWHVDGMPCVVLGLGIGMLRALVLPERHLSSSAG